MANNSYLKTIGLEVLGLASVAITLPVFSTLGEGAAFLVAHAAQPQHIIVFALTLYLLPAAVLVLIYAVLRLVSSSASRIFIALVCCLLVSLWCLTLLSGAATAVAVTAALLLGILSAYLYLSRAVFRDFLRLMGILSPAVLLMFLVFSPVNKLLTNGSGDAAGQGAARDVPIVMLLLDELSLYGLVDPDGEIDAGRLPGFARLASLSTWYDNATTVSVQTETAVAGILSGMRPKQGTQPVYSEFPRNLFSLVQASHEVHALETLSRLCPRAVCSSQAGRAPTSFDMSAFIRDLKVVWLHAVLPAELAQQRLPSIADKWRDFGEALESPSAKKGAGGMQLVVQDLERNQQRRFDDFLAGINSEMGVELHYAHVLFPHVPWAFLPDGTVYNGRMVPGKSSNRRYDWRDSQYLVDHGVLRYGLAIQYLDKQIGRFLDTLERSGRLDDMLVIVLADHGIAFAPGQPRRTPSAVTVADVAHVPLFIKYPEQKTAVRDSRPVETIDILPTVADILGISLAGTMDGQSLRSDAPRRHKRTILEASAALADIDANMDVATARQRIHRVLIAGKNAQEAIGLGAGRPYFGQPNPNVEVKQGPELYLESAAWYAGVGLQSGFLPARLTGTIAGLPVGATVLIGLNGTIAGSGEIFDASGDLSVMLDPRQFKAGSNELRAYLLRDTDSPVELKVVSDVSGWALSSENGIVVAVRDEAGVEYAADASLSGKASFGASRTMDRLRGWACDESGHQAPIRVLLVEGERVLTTAFWMEARIQLSQQQGNAEDIECAFSIELNEQLMLRKRDLSVVALFAGGRMIQLTPGNTRKKK